MDIFAQNNDLIEVTDPGEIIVSSPEDGDQEDDVIFVLHNIPGAPEAEDVIIDENEEDEDEEEEEANEEEPITKWKWGHDSFIPWLQDMIKNIPQHNGYDTTGLEKAISYFEALDREITKAMRTDYDNLINSAHAEKAREQIESGLERLIDRLDKVKTTKYKRHAKKNSKAWHEQYGIVKEAGTPKILGITVTVPLFIARLARVCINGMVSAGHDLEDMFEKLSKEYNLDKRERAELSQLIEDMGYPMRQDRGYPVGEPVDQTRSDNFDWSASYHG